jgi:uncharacterized protein YodC (DUF2158 family)
MNSTILKTQGKTTTKKTTERKTKAPVAPSPQVGDVVVLNSGGPTMTVLDICACETAEMVRVGWFLDDAAQTQVYPAAALTLLS